MDYKQMLERAKKSLPEEDSGTARFEIPKVLGHIQGNKTVINNFYQIATAFNRPPEHLLKYVLKELATPGELKKSAAIVGRKISASNINDKINKYAKDFVLCTECQKPDTKLIKENKIMFIKCTACGARHAVKVKI
ncbi:MAG: translation initiation factor IF-2 subunit beta [bacterium]|nr:translation initiation factor IF-2 subunit beta [bacterium]